jgi:hypothetical protein
MSICRDIDDTANLPSAGARSSTVYPLRADDTARMQVSTTARDYREKGGMHPFAEGIIRFYRARTILEGDLNEAARWNRAWRYLEKLSPHDLPPMTRKAFFELTYFMQEQEGHEPFQAEQFRSRVRSIANRLDGYVDELNAGFDG